MLDKKEGWLIHLENTSGKSGWGEVAPIEATELKACANILNQINSNPSRQELEDRTSLPPKALAFGIGAALAELDDLIGVGSKGWLKAPTSAVLLPSHPSLLENVDCLVKAFNQKSTDALLTVKLKVGIQPRYKEEKILHQVLKRLPENARLRLDANGGWNRDEAKKWVSHFLEEPRLEWIEQPLPVEDLEGLLELSKQIPVALDESLIANPSLRKNWQDWQVRRPLVEGDPRELLNELSEGIGYRVVSTAFETGIGSRWVHHLAALQQRGPTPTAPGLAPGWCPSSPLFSKDPALVWEAA